MNGNGNVSTSFPTLGYYEGLSKGFFLGFTAAQFFSGWISGPMVVVIILVYVFASEYVQRLGSLVPGVFVKHVMSLLVRVGLASAQADPNGGVIAFNNNNNNYQFTDVFGPLNTPGHHSPFYSI